MKKKGVTPKRGRKTGGRNKENIFGNVEDYEVGYTWKTRDDLSDSGVHRPKVACLHAGIDGVYSILINSKYRGDDSGYAITYSGPCVRDNGHNGAYNDSLIKNYNNNIPVRIIRGTHKESPFAPLSGYRYDGLYLIHKYWKLNNKILFYFKRMQQAAPPWLKLIRRRDVCQSPELLENDRDISSYVSFIRDQKRPVSNLEVAKEEQINSIEDVCPDSPGSSSEPPTEDTRLTIENVSLITGNETSIRSENQILESLPPLVLPADQPTTFSAQPRPTEEHLNPEKSTESAEPTAWQSKTLIGGMPMPLMKYETCKEEYSAGFVVYEGVTTLPGEEVVEVYNERVIYEEQETGVTECVNSDEEDDYELVEEEEVDCSYLRDFSTREIVTATELVETININSEMIPEGYYDVDVEDGPKYGYTRRYLEAAHLQNDYMNVEGPTVQNALSVAIVKSDDLIPSEQVPVSEIDIHTPYNMVPEQNIYTSIEMKHDMDNENIVEESHIKPSFDAEASTSELQIGKIIGRCMYFDGNNDSKTVIESTEAFNQNLVIPSCTLHDMQRIQMMYVEEEEAKTSKSIINNDEETSQDINDGSKENVNSSLGDKPDSTSNMVVETNKQKCDCNCDDCPLQTFNLLDSIGVLLKDFGSNNICKTLKTLPCWNIYKKILKGENTGKAVVKVQENNRKAVLPPPSDGNSEKDIGIISNVQFGVDGLETWNRLATSDDAIPSNVQDDNNGSNIQSNKNQELVTYNDSAASDNSDSHSVSKFKALRIKAVEELCHVLLSKIQQIKESKEYGDALAELENESLRDDLEQKVLQKFSSLPCFANEKKEVLLQHRKRKYSNESERGSNQTAHEINQPVSKVRMVQYRRNIRTEINRTRILKINQTCESTSEEGENFNCFDEQSDEGKNITRETQVQDDDFLIENCNNSGNQSDEEMSDNQLYSSEESEDSSDESSEEDAHSNADVSDYHISKPSLSSNGNEISSSSSFLFQTVDSDEDTNNPESTTVQTCEELCEPMSPLLTTDHESNSKKRKFQLKSSQSTKKINESLPSTSTKYSFDDNFDPNENFEGYSIEDSIKSEKRKELFNRRMLKHVNEIISDVVSSSLSTLNSKQIESPSIPTRPKSLRTKRVVQRYDL
ncbi:hypothetical protein O3M35_011499 [Rhynocoris fuscipes]|uniref:YDG domain-containing protein n=1 Tax=Rhynocoris fuscipes TaxID=488301 RepID=A0AAW1CYB6_9HEMI